MLDSCNTPQKSNVNNKNIMSLDPQRYETNSAFFRAIVNSLKDNKNDPTELAKILVQPGAILLLQTESIIDFLKQYIPEKLASFDSKTQPRERAEFAATLLNFFNILPQMELPAIMPFKTEADDKDFNHFQEVSITGIETLLADKYSPFNAERMAKNEQTAGTLARIQTHLISLYIQRLYGDKAENCKTAIKLAKQALGALSPEASLKEYVQVASLMSLAFKKLSQNVPNEKEHYLNLAVEAYESIVNSETIKKQDMQTWATTNNNLANTLLEMAGSTMLIDILDPSNNQPDDKIEQRITYIDKAVKRFSDALEFKVEEIQWSTMMMNLGYAHLAMVNALFIGGIVNTEPNTHYIPIIPGAINEAKRCFTEALTVIKPNAQRGAEWARIKIYQSECDLYEFLFIQIEQEKRMDKLHAVIEALKSACKLFSLTTGPSWFARAQYHMGTVYEFLAKQCSKDEKDAKLDLEYKAVELYQNVAKVYANSDTKIVSNMKDRIELLQIDLEGYNPPE